jgi:hypothetical protein
VVVTKEIYQAYWKMENREKYLRQLDKKYQLLCLYLNKTTCYAGGTRQL